MGISAGFGELLVHARQNGCADDFFRLILGARSIQSVDYPDYQHANLVHDLNTPLPESWKERFDALIVAGSFSATDSTDNSGKCGKADY